MSVALPVTPSAARLGRLFWLLSLLLLVVLLAGCGGRAQGAEVNAPETNAPEANAPESETRSAAAPERAASAPKTAEEPESAASVPVAEAAGDAPLDTVAPLPVGAFASKAILPPDRLELPSIGLDADVVELGWTSQTLETGEIFSEWEEADSAAGWHKNSLRPGFGGNVVLSGHNNIMGAVFRELDLLKRGDSAFLYVDNLKFEYVIDKVLIVPEKFATEEQKAKNFAYIEPTEDERLTLVSCWPRDDNTHRIIVVAHPVESSVVK
jgi:sortase A